MPVGCNDVGLDVVGTTVDGFIEDNFDVGLKVLGFDEVGLKVLGLDDVGLKVLGFDEDGLNVLGFVEDGLFEDGLLDVVGRVGTVVGMVNFIDMLNCVDDGKLDGWVINSIDMQNSD